MSDRPKTLGELKESGYRQRSIKEEMRENLIEHLSSGGSRLFPDVLGFEDSVEPQIANALLAKHDILLLGLRGQAKTRIARSLTRFLDDFLPIVAGSEVNDDPLAPVSHFGRATIEEKGDAALIEWVAAEQRYGEKLATPDVSIADLIGDIDPIKAANRRLSFADERAIHFGIIPRTNRGIFVVNELPDLQPRIQVGLFNIMQERDIQIRGFNIRFPLDVVIVFTANPQDYTNRGAIITPLKDRIDSQILTHYPRDVSTGIAVMRQEARLADSVAERLVIPEFIEEIVETTAMQARRSDFVDQAAGVSVRMTISMLEAVVANAERRALVLGEEPIVPRMVDLQQGLTGVTGKTELVFEGEQEGPITVAKALVGLGVRSVFERYFPHPNRKGTSDAESTDPYAKILAWFAGGNSVTIDDAMSTADYVTTLSSVPGLADLAAETLAITPSDLHMIGLGMEFVLEGLHHHSKVAKDDRGTTAGYRDMVGSIFSSDRAADDEGSGDWQ